MEPSRPAAEPVSSSTKPCLAASQALKALTVVSWQFQPDGQLCTTPLPLFSTEGNSSGCLSASSMVLIEGLASATYFGIHQPSTPPSFSDFAA
ncbi:hypothetical protein FQZ97_844800 [compost metagenome]